MSTYAIGDLQGCLEPLQRLLERVNFDPSEDKLWLVGDLINRGPDSLQTLRLVYQLRHSVTVVLGNHDLHFLAVACGHRHQSRHDTFDTLLEADDLTGMMTWLRGCPLLHRDPQLGFTMVHAGIPPIWDLAQAEARAREVEAVLQGDQFEHYLAHMYGNEPSRWGDQLVGPERWRLITNYFTRMRFCTAEGELELRTKASAEQHPVGFLPWFAHPEHRCRHDKILFGHWAALRGQTTASNVYALDTGCVWGGSLTALRLEDERLFHCRCQ